VRSKTLPHWGATPHAGVVDDHVERLRAAQFERGLQNLFPIGQVRDHELGAAVDQGCERLRTLGISRVHDDVVTLSEQRLRGETA
jgi:hypothetical protein